MMTEQQFEAMLELRKLLDISHRHGRTDHLPSAIEILDNVLLADMSAVVAKQMKDLHPHELN